jgi:hypothetical protein
MALNNELESQIDALKVDVAKLKKEKDGLLNRNEYPSLKQ